MNEDRYDDRTPEPFRPLGIVGECPNCDGRVYSNEHGGVCSNCGCEQPEFVEPVEPIAANALALPPETDVPLPEPQTRDERRADLARWYAEHGMAELAEFFAKAEPVRGFCDVCGTDGDCACREVA